jgi:nitrous oxide reductase accessory protein NosL
VHITILRVGVGVMALFLACAPPAAPAAEAKDATICQLCGMDAAESETEFIVHLKAAPDMHACCINCARRIMKKVGADVVSGTALDYRTRKHVAAADAFYVIGSERVPEGSMTPFVFAFGFRKDADEFHGRYGGRVLTFKEILAELEAVKKGR